MTTTNQVPWPTAAGDAQPSAGTVSSQRRAFGDARARLENSVKQNANTGNKPSDNNLPTKEKMSTATSASDAGISKPLSSRRSNAGSSGGESIVAKFGAIYGGTTTPSGKSSNSSNNNAADKENASSDHQDTEKSSSAEASAGTSSAGSASTSRNPVTSPKFQSLRDAFQKRSDSSAGGPGAVIPSLSDGFGGNNNSNNSNGNGNGGRSKSTGRPAAAASSSGNSTRRAARESRSKSTIRPSRGSGVEVYDEGINDDNNNNTNNATNDDAATTPADAAEFASPQVRVSKSKMQKMKQSNVRLKSEAWEKGVRLHQTQSALYDLKKENEELRSTSNGSAASTPSAAARQSSTSSVASNATESSSSGQEEMYSKLRRNLEGQADTLQAQLDAEVKKSRSLERQIDEMRATSTAANQWSDKKKQHELQNDLSAAISDLAAKNKEISKLQANLKKAAAVAQYDNVNNGDDSIHRRREVEIQSLRKSLNDFKSLHSDCDLKTELLTEKEAKLLARLSHPSIVRMYDTAYRSSPVSAAPPPRGFMHDGGNPASRPQHLILMEYCEGGTALSVCNELKNAGQRFDLPSLIIAFGQICNAVSYLHAQVSYGEAWRVCRGCKVKPLTLRVDISQPIPFCSLNL